MKLLGTPASPYVWKVRIAFEEKHIPYEYVFSPPPIQIQAYHNTILSGKFPSSFATMRILFMTRQLLLSTLTSSAAHQNSYPNPLKTVSKSNAGKHSVTGSLIALF